MVTSWSVDPQQPYLNTDPKASIVIMPSDSGRAKRGTQTLLRPFSCWTIWRGNNRPGRGMLALCSLIIWSPLARLCPLFTPSDPEQTSPLAGVPFLQAPFCILDAGEFTSSRIHFLLAWCRGLRYSSCTSTCLLPVPVGTVMSSARGAERSTVTDPWRTSPSGSAQFGSLVFCCVEGTCST